MSKCGLDECDMYGGCMYDCTSRRGKKLFGEFNLGDCKYCKKPVYRKQTHAVNSKLEIMHEKCRAEATRRVADVVWIDDTEILAEKYPHLSPIQRKLKENARFFQDRKK